jgi:hypothetical protein
MYRLFACIDLCVIYLIIVMHERVDLHFDRNYGNKMLADQTLRKLAFSFRRDQLYIHVHLRPCANASTVVGEMDA